MDWKLLPTNYKDIVWSGLKKYTQINNDDGTISFRDDTVYTHKESSFFGAKDANQINEAVNYIMTNLENGFMPNDVTFSQDGRTITEKSRNKKVVTEFVSNTVIVQKLYIDEVLSLTKTITFLNGGKNVKEVVE